MPIKIVCGKSHDGEFLFPSVTFVRGVENYRSVELETMTMMQMQKLECDGFFMHRNSYNAGTTLEFYLPDELEKRIIDLIQSEINKRLLL